MNGSKNDRSLVAFIRRDSLSLTIDGHAPENGLSADITSHGFDWPPPETGHAMAQLQDLLADRSSFFWKRLVKLQAGEAAVHAGAVRGHLLMQLRQRWGG